VLEGHAPWAGSKEARASLQGAAASHAASQVIGRTSVRKMKGQSLSLPLTLFQRLEASE